MGWKQEKYLEINRPKVKSIYPDANVLKDYFSFLEKSGFTVTRADSFSYGSYVEFKGNGMKVYLGFDFKGYTFYFDLYKDENLAYSDDEYGKNIIPFSSLDNSHTINELQPNRSKGYEIALKNNVEVLKKYMKFFLKTL